MVEDRHGGRQAWWKIDMVENRHGEEDTHGGRQARWKIDMVEDRHGGR